MEDSVKKALRKMLNVAVFAKQKDDNLANSGCSHTLLFDLYGGAADAIYYLIGEYTNTFEESVTYNAINQPGLLPEERLTLLTNEYEKNHTEQNRPAP